MRAIPQIFLLLSAVLLSACTPLSVPPAPPASVLPGLPPLSCDTSLFSNVTAQNTKCIAEIIEIRHNQDGSCSVKIANPIYLFGFATVVRWHLAVPGVKFISEEEGVSIKRDSDGSRFHVVPTGDPSLTSVALAEDNHFSTIFENAEYDYALKFKFTDPASDDKSSTCVADPSIINPRILTPTPGGTIQQ